jgi:hypothetical protein
MTPRIIVGIVALLSVSASGLLSTFMTFEMVDKVNEKLPETEKFAQLGWYLSKRQRLNREYRRFYPDGRLLLRVRILMALMFVCLFVAAWGFGFFTK